VAVEARPLIHSSGASATSETPACLGYSPVTGGFEALHCELDARLREYNETNPVMDLVLFQQVEMDGQTQH
jgi:hypothetical protein